MPQFTPETQPASLEERPRGPGLSLYWRTFWALCAMFITILLVWIASAAAARNSHLDISTPTGLVVSVLWGLTLTLLAASVGSRLLNRPLRDLSFAASRVLGGDLGDSLLDEDAATPEIREVNTGFNRMAAQLSRIEQDRATMLAGISHDLRTPLTRLRIETEISVENETARQHMVADIEQLDRTIDKFLDYARPESTATTTVCVNDVVEAAMQGLHPDGGLRVVNMLTEDVFVMADEVDLSRVLANLFENARRYGKAPGADIAVADVYAKVRENTVSLRVRDHGPGVPQAMLRQLTKPFFRGDTARTAATGAGLGLAIVEKAIQRMGGNLSLDNAPDGGLLVTVRLVRSKRGR